MTSIDKEWMKNNLAFLDNLIISPIYGKTIFSKKKAKNRAIYKQLLKEHQLLDYKKLCQLMRSQKVCCC